MLVDKTVRELIANRIIVLIESNSNWKSVKTAWTKFNCLVLLAPRNFETKRVHLSPTRQRTVWTVSCVLTPLMTYGGILIQTEC